MFSKSTIFIVSFWLAFFSLPVAAQKSFRLKDYISNRVGDVWQYKNLAPDGLSPIIVKNAETVEFKGLKVTKRTENNGDYRLQTLDEKGLTVYQLYFIGERVIEYEKPVLLMPAKLKAGASYRSETLYKTFVKGELKEQGKQTYEVRVEEKTQDVKIGDKTYKNCLILTTIALRIDESGTQKGYEIREYHAKNLGAVKVTGELFWKNSNGETTRTFKINAEME